MLLRRGFLQPKMRFSIVLVCFVVGAWGLVAEAGHFLVSHSLIQFTVDGFTGGSWLASELIQVQRLGPSSDRLELAATGLPPELHGLVFMQVNDDIPRELGSSALEIMAGKDDYAEIRLFLKPESVWKKAGTYGLTLDFRGQKVANVDVTIQINQFASLEVVAPQVVKINALDGPGRYGAQEVITVQVRSNHERWTVLLDMDGLNYLGEGSAPGIAPTEFFVAVSNGGSERVYQPLVWLKDNMLEQLVLGPVDFSLGYTTLYLAADVDWHHRAGNYAGTLKITLLPN